MAKALDEEDLPIFAERSGDPDGDRECNDQIERVGDLNQVEFLII